MTADGVIERRCAAGGAVPSRIRIGAPVAARLAAALAARLGARRRFVLADRRALTDPADAAVADLAVDGGEAIKDLTTLARVLDALAAAGIERDAVLVAVGGGTVGDLGGLAAALWLRGIELVMVPTTLLAMVDSSVGGKTAINVAAGKNLVGVFWPATEVWIDPGWLATLPDAEFRSGVGEIAKIAIGLDPELFERLERDAAALLARDPAVVGAAIDRCVAAKIAVVEADPREHGARRLLNLGHTLGHALEARSGYTLPHGVAVARGIHHVIGLAERRGALAADDAARCRRLLEALGFAADPLPPVAELRGFLARDKKVASGRLHAVLPTAPGRSDVVAMDPAEFV